MAMSSRRRFGQRPPPVSRLIKTILDRYPDGQIFKELIQNADDAGAKVVHFYIDTRQHPTTSLVTNSLAAYQGPALIVANDAMFKAKDWEGIERLQDSIKAEDPFNVGKYGIGFNSVYHITGRKVPIYLYQKTIEDRDDNRPTQSAFRCGEESFQCTNKICVPISSYCNGVDDCGDESDEPKLCQTAKISSTTKSNSKIFTGLITGIINSILAGTTLDDFVTRVMAKILGAPALDDFIDGVISKIMGWMILLIILIIIITSVPFSLLLVCALRPGCTIYKWRHHHLQDVQPPPQLVRNSNESAQRPNTDKN